jgi:3-phenylpropionate/trans-cinnamate dioxygenase ferredoxin subunit
MLNYREYSPKKIEYISVGTVDEVKEGQRIFIDIDEMKIVVFNISGNYYAIADVCSHDDGPVGEGNIDGYEIGCPRHGARFDIRTGKAISLPAFVDIPAYPVRIVNGQIEIGIPFEE